MSRLAAVLALILSACGTVAPSAPAQPGGVIQGEGPEDLAAARDRWGFHGYDDYKFTISRSCFCPPEVTGPFLVTVRDGDVVSATRAGQPLAPSVTVPSVEHVFDEIGAAYAAGAASVRVSYDGTTGHPVEVWIDLDEMMADEEMGYTISGLSGD